VKDDTAVAKEGWISWSEGEVLVGVVCREAWESGNGSVFAAQVTNLTRSRAALVAWSSLATSERIEMSGGSSAISRGRHRLVVDVVDYWHVLVVISCESAAYEREE
jgi:hypothetical protein